MTTTLGGAGQPPSAGMERYGREQERGADRQRRLDAAAGSHLPTADQLLRGYPFLHGDIASDIRAFVASPHPSELERAARDSLKRLAAAARGSDRDRQPDAAAISEALRACRFSEASDPDGTIRLRCAFYAAFLGDSEAAQAVAAEAALMAYMQEWHREGDGSDLVWEAMAWCALAAVWRGPYRNPPYPVREMDSIRDRLDAFADEFRTRVFRLAREID